MHLTGFPQSDRARRTLGRGLAFAVWAFALLVLVQVGPLPLSHGAEKEGSTKMNNWQTSAAWRKYKAAYTLARVTKSVRVLAKLERELDSSRAALERAFARRPEIASELWDALSARIEDSADALRKRLGKRLPHWRRDLEKSLEALVHESNALRGLRELGAQDSWIDNELGPSVKSLCEGTSHQAILLERYEPNEPTTAPLVAKARQAIANAQDLLPPPGRPPTDAR